MAVVVEIRVLQASKADHEALDAGVEAAMGQQGGPPAGLMAHFARPEGDGFVICDVWRSEADMRPFVDGVILPALAAAGLASEEPIVSPAWGFARP